MPRETSSKGFFAVFEGVEGSGKTTQSEGLTRRLSEAGRDVRLTIEPGGTPTGERIREWIKSGAGITPLTELYLFSAARAALVETVIAPAIEAGQDIVCDRYIYSTVAYQGYARGIDRQTIDTLNSLATNGLEPDLVILLDLPPDQGFGRKVEAELDRIELEDMGFHLKVRQGYLQQAQLDPDRWLVLDATLPEADLADAIWKRVSTILGVR